MQTGQAESGMQTMNQSLIKALINKLIHRRRSKSIDGPRRA